MSLVTPSIFGTPSFPNRSMVLNLKSNSLSSFPAALYYTPHHKVPTTITNKTHTVFKQRKPSVTLISCATAPENSSQFYTEDASSFDLGGEDFDESVDMDSPWEGSVIYKRNSAVAHVEYCTTLERLGFENLSTETSKSRASAMGLRVTKAVKDFPFGTPVQVSIDVTRKKKKLRLDGIVKTVITLGCNRCGEAAAESIYSNFSLLLTEEVVEQPDIIDMGTIFGESKCWTGGFGGDENGEEEEDNEEASFDMDDILYFPHEQKEIDISKTIRDLVHLEITINAVCDPSCRGLCLKCGANLNTSACRCSQSTEVENNKLGPLGDLKKQMQCSKGM